MVKILVPTDGSEPALRAVAHAVRRVTECGGGEIRLLNVQPLIPESVGDFVGADAVLRFQREEGDKALGEAKAKLSRANVPHHAEARVGSVAETVADHAAETGCDEIVMGSRGLGSLSGVLLGSVATRVLHLATVPVTVVK